VAGAGRGCRLSAGRARERGPGGRAAAASQRRATGRGLLPAGRSGAALPGGRAAAASQRRAARRGLLRRPDGGAGVLRRLDGAGGAAASCMGGGGELHGRRRRAAVSVGAVAAGSSERGPVAVG